MTLPDVTPTPPRFEPRPASAPAPLLPPSIDAALGPVPAGTTVVEVIPAPGPNDERWTMVVHPPAGAVETQRFENRSRALTVARERALAGRPSRVVLRRKDGGVEEHIDFAPPHPAGPR